MGDFLSKLFIDPAAYELPDDLVATFHYNGSAFNQTISSDICDVEGRLSADGFGVVQLLLLMGVYGYMLFLAAALIGDGSELLLLVPSLKGVVGSLVLPILGAVPDGAIVLFSGMGPNAQSQLSVGVGALAGSTIMLLTLTWGLTIVAGKVDIETGRDGKRACQYKKKNKCTNSGMTNVGVQPTGAVAKSCKIMLLTSVSYVVIQIPAISKLKVNANDPNLHIAHEKTFALIGFVMCLVFFVGNLAYQALDGDDDVTDAKVDRQRMKGIQNKLINFEGAFVEEIEQLKATHAGKTAGSINAGPTSPLLATQSSSLSRTVDGGRPASSKVRVRRERLVSTDISTVTRELHAYVSKNVWNKVDTNKDGEVSAEELVALFDHLGEKVSLAQAMRVRESYDLDHDHKLSKEEFMNIFTDWALGHLSLEAPPSSDKGAEDGDEDEEQEEEDDEIPEDLLDLSPEEQQAAIKKRAFGMMAGGLVLVLLFSDPMVDCMTALGERVNVSSFYISFVLAPLASNASELLAGYQYALKKTTASISVAQSQLIGAGIMNNTFCLLVFMMLIWVQPIQWAYSAETITILVVEFAVAIVAFKPIQTQADAYFVFALYPLSLVLVTVLEQVVGLD